VLDPIPRRLIVRRQLVRWPIVCGLALATGTCAEEVPPPSQSALASRSDAGLASPADAAPAFMLGEFIDDYGIRYSIGADSWTQHPDARYRLRAWQVDDQILVAQNHAANSSDGGLWTRIDWLRLDESSEYEWAFCYAAYKAGSPEDALAAPPTQRDTPRVGCNGFPFSRMKRVAVGGPESK